MKKTFIKVSSIAMLALSSIGFVGCGEDAVDPPVAPVVDALEGNIAENMTLTADKSYLLKGKVFVQAGATLTIEPGTIIYGDKATAAALIVNRGAKIDAVGTAEKPIVFTSNQPAGLRDTGDWAGVVLLGNGISNKGENVTIEGISAAEGENGLFGGSNNADNSGKLSFVRIEYAGIALAPNNELNSLTMGGVGSGTQIDHIIVSYAGDDSYEWFGGAVNASYLIANRGIDDDFDTDQGYNGNLTYGFAQKDPALSDMADGGGSRGMENSSSSSENAIVSMPKFKNFTMVGPKVFGSIEGTNHANAVRNDKFSQASVENSVFIGYVKGFENKIDGGVDGKGTFSNNVLVAVEGDATLKNVEEGTNTIISVADLSTQLTGTPALDMIEEVKVTGHESKGAFVSEATAWNLESNWMVLDAQDVDYENGMLK
ncbi:T9SS C-terminal target domain-containing protein [Algivirga pacifica]|uniref:Multidrug transporter n=1 Tax=Algivirga pacifica TaxID=1162670 RepID=A0ABP9DJQ3_9BACT